MYSSFVSSSVLKESHSLKVVPRYSPSITRIVTCNCRPNLPVTIFGSVSFATIGSSSAIKSLFRKRLPAIVRFTSNYYRFCNRTYKLSDSATHRRYNLSISFLLRGYDPVFLEAFGVHPSAASFLFALQESNLFNKAIQHDSTK